MSTIRMALVYTSECASEQLLRMTTIMMIILTWQ